MTTEAPLAIGEPVLAGTARAHSIDEIEPQLARIWASQDLDDDDRRRTGAPRRGPDERDEPRRRRPEAGDRRAQRRGHPGPDRTPSVADDRSSGSADPDGPSWLDARVEAHCVLPRDDAPEICAETIHLTSGGEAGRHLAAIVTPLIIHDLPVTVWWPGEPPFDERAGARPAGGRRPPHRRRLDLERRRARPPASRWPACSRRPASRSATSRSSASRAGARRSRRSSTTPTSCRTCARCGGSR